MNKLTNAQMENLQGGAGAAGCAASVGLGALGFAGGMILAGGPIGAGAALFAIGMWHASVLAGCLL